MGASLATGDGGSSGEAAAALRRHANTLLQEVAPLEMRTDLGSDDHTAINKVMLASALDPKAFERLAEEPSVSL